MVMSSGSIQFPSLIYIVGPTLCRITVTFLLVCMIKTEMLPDTTESRKFKIAADKPEANIIRSPC